MQGFMSQDGRGGARGVVLRSLDFGILGAEETQPAGTSHHLTSTLVSQRHYKSGQDNDRQEQVDDNSHAFSAEECNLSTSTAFAVNAIRRALKS